MKTTQNEEPEPKDEDEEKREPYFGPKSIWGGVGGGAR